MSSNRDREEGRFTENVSLEDVLGVFEQVRGPVVTSGDVADYLDCSRETARRKLRKLEDGNRVASRKTAGRVVWWLTDTEEAVDEINPDDPFWNTDPHAGDDTVSEDDLDDILYGKAES